METVEFMKQQNQDEIMYNVDSRTYTVTLQLQYKLAYIQ